MAKPIPTQDDLRRLFVFDESRGLLIWRERPVSDFKNGLKYPAEFVAKCWNTRYVGKIAGRVAEGYRLIRFTMKSYRLSYPAHHLIWFLVNGEWPKEIDHKNGFEFGDVIENLRHVTHADNMKNLKMHARNTSGVSGVDSYRNKWRARINVSGRELVVGYFKNKDDAIVARKNAERTYGFHENHGRVICR